MYTKTIIESKFPNDVPAQFDVRLDSGSYKETAHHFSLYGCVYRTEPAATESGSLSEIVELLRAMANDANSYVDASPDQISRFKREAPVAVFSELEGGKKTNAAFRSTSLIAVDVDQKGVSQQSVIDIPKLLARIEHAGLAAILYTTFSYRPKQPCFRVLIDIGKSCDWDDYQRACIWLKSNLLSDLYENGAIDIVSWRPVQPMVLPSGYRYQKPIVKHVKGNGLWELFSEELSKIAVVHPEKTNKGEKLRIGEQNLTGEPERLFVEQVAYQHKPLKFAQQTPGSMQFWRSREDVNAGLYCKDEWKAIFDPAKSKRHRLQYSLIDYRAALAHKQTKRSVREGAIRDWIDSEVPYALFTENCGTGKSEVLVLLSSDSPDEQRYVFTFSTIANRDAFAARAHNAVVVKSTSEIIKDVVGEVSAQRVLAGVERYFKSLKNIETRRDGLSEVEGGSSAFLDKFLKKEEKKVEGKRSMTAALKACVSKGLISHEDFRLIRSEMRKSTNNQRKTQHLLMTTRKFDYLVGYADENPFRDDIIFTDEHLLGMLTNIDEAQKFEVYGSDWSPENLDEIDRQKLHDLKRCIVTSEDVAAHELKYNNIQFDEIAAVHKTADFETLEVLWVPSTSSQRISGGKSRRQDIKGAVDRSVSSDTVVIGDKLQSDYNLVNCKGSNELREKNTVVIVSMPSPQEVARTRACTGLSHCGATSVIMSDKANQAVGRNQGYRNKDEHGNPSSGSNRCLLIIPTKKSEFEIDLHYVTPKVVSAKRWMSTNDGWKISSDRKKDFYFRNVIEEIVVSI